MNECEHFYERVGQSTHHPSIVRCRCGHTLRDALPSAGSLSVDALVDWALKQDLDAERIRREAWPEHEARDQ